MDIKGKIAIVTGAASGIGRATAIAFANHGVKGVAISDIDMDGLGETAKAIENTGATALKLSCDVTDAASLQHMYDETDAKFSQIDIVFNNAGIVSGPPPFPDTDLARIKLVIDIDLTSVIQSSAIAIKYMRERGGGVIINTASTGGLNPYLADAQYAASKAGVIMFSRSCGDLHEQCNIRVNAVCPGVTETPILDKTGGGVRPDWLGPLLENINILTGDDIADAVLNIVANDQMAGDFVVVENEPL
jgi:3-oxoacyl-[acyl-carrier protein] reductase